MYEGKLRQEVSWSALALCILGDYTPEQALERLDPNPDIKVRENARMGAVFTTLDVEDMISLKNQGLSYRELGAIYNIDQSTVYKKIKKFKESRQDEAS